MSAFGLKTTVLAGTFALGLTATAQAASITQPFTDDAGFLAFLGQPGVSETFVAEGRIGDLGGTGEREIGLYTPPGFTGQAPIAGNTNFAWGNNQPVAFTLARVGDTVTFSMGNYAASYSDSAVGDVNALAFRLRATGTSSLTLSDLELDGAPLATLSRNANGAEYWLLSTIMGDFSLTGEATLAWTGTAPTRSNLAFQIKGLETPVEVPEPASLALLGMGLLGLGFAARRRVTG